MKKTRRVRKDETSTERRLEMVKQKRVEVKLNKRTWIKRKHQGKKGGPQ